MLAGAPAPPVLAGQCLAMWPVPPHSRQAREGQVRPRWPISSQTLHGPTLAFHPSSLASATAPDDALGAAEAGDLAGGRDGSADEG